MWKYLSNHEKYILKKIVKFEKQKSPDIKEVTYLKSLHEKRIRFIQHERFIHLIVTLFIALYLLLTLGFSMIIKTWIGLSLSLLLLSLTFAYIIHYFRLENGIQRWYLISDRLDKLINSIKNR